MLYYYFEIGHNHFHFTILINIIFLFDTLPLKLTVNSVITEETDENMMKVIVPLVRNINMK